MAGTLDELFKAIGARFAEERAARIAASDRIGALLEEYRASTDAALMERYAAPYGVALPTKGRRAAEVAIELWECVRALPEIAELEGRDPSEALASIAPPAPSAPAVPPVAPAAVLTYPRIRAAGRPVLLFGGSPEPAKEKRLQALVGAATWVGGDAGIDGTAAQIRNGKYAVVLIATALAGHAAVKKLVDAAKAGGVPYESVESAGIGSLTKALDAIEASLAT